MTPFERKWRVVKNGAPHLEHLTFNQASEISEQLVTSDPNGGPVKVEPMEAPEPVSVPMPAHVAHLLAKAPPIPTLAPGTERDNLREKIATFGVAVETLAGARAIADRASAHLDACRHDLAELKAAEAHDTRQARDALVERFKAGTAAPLIHANGASGQHIAKAVAKVDAAALAHEHLADEMTAAEAKLKIAETVLRQAADIVIQAEINDRVRRLEEMRYAMRELEDFVWSGNYAGFPYTPEAVAALRPAMHDNENHVGQIVNYRKALMRDAGAQLADQAKEVA